MKSEAQRKRGFDGLFFPQVFMSKTILQLTGLVMGLRGTKPKPTALKIARGSAKKDAKRINRSEPRPPTEGRRNPYPVRSVAGKAWREMVDMAKAMKVLSDADYAMVKLYADACELYEKAKADIAKHGMTEGRFQRPAVHIIEKTHKQQVYILTQFGMSPSSRASVSVTDGDSNSSPMAKLVAGG